MASLQESLLKCPYNGSHLISRRRYLIHLINCGKNPANPSLVICPFNAIHRISKADYKDHLLSCREATKSLLELIKPFSQIDEKNEKTIQWTLPSKTDEWMISEKINKIRSLPGLQKKLDLKSAQNYLSNGYINSVLWQSLSKDDRNYLQALRIEKIMEKKLNKK